MYLCPMPMLHLQERLSLAINSAIQPVCLRQTPRPTPEGRRNRMIITAPFLVAAMARRRLLSVCGLVGLRPLFGLFPFARPYFTNKVYTCTPLCSPHLSSVDWRTLVLFASLQSTIDSNVAPAALSTYFLFLDLRSY